MYNLFGDIPYRINLKNLSATTVAECSTTTNREISMPNDIQTPKGYLNALSEAKTLIYRSQEKFLKSANRITMEIRFNLGKIIEENTVRHDWGKAVLENFAKDLLIAFPNTLGFSTRNLAYMRQFYSEYKSEPSDLNAAMEVSWGTNIEIMTKVKEDNARRFYLEMAAETMCSRDVIAMQISSKAYEREFYQDKKHNFDSTLPAVQASKAENILKPNYFFEIMEPLPISGQLLESKLENEMIYQIKDVIMMLGKGFAFISNQYLLNAGDNTYRIDLLFSNRITQSLVAVELKMTRFQAEYAGKMNLYLKLLDKKVKLPHENPSIGLILCSDRNDLEVDYILPDLNRPIGVAELILSKTLPKELEGKLPDPKTLRNEILHKIDSMPTDLK